MQKRKRCLPSHELRQRAVDQKKKKKKKARLKLDVKVRGIRTQDPFTKDRDRDNVHVPKKKKKKKGEERKQSGKAKKQKVIDNVPGSGHAHHGFQRFSGQDQRSSWSNQSKNSLLLYLQE